MNWRLVTAFVGASTRRLVAAGLAIAIGTAFLTASILSMSTISQTARASVARPYGTATLLVTGVTGQAQIDAIAATPGVQASEFSPWLTVTFGDPSSASARWSGVNTMPSSPELRNIALLAGTWAAPGQVVVSASFLDTADLGIGDQVTLGFFAVPTGEAEPEPVRLGFTISGTVPDAAAIDASRQPTIFVHPTDAMALAQRFRPNQDPAAPAPLGNMFIATAAGATATVAQALKPHLGAHGLVQSIADTVSEQLEYVSGDQRFVYIVSLSFVAIAIVVAGLVVANTFQVLMAHRRHTIGLLRCVGASRRQIAGLVLTEAALLGVSASIVGVSLGVGLVALAVWILQHTNEQVALAPILPLPLVAIWVPMVCGVLVTLIAATMPARMAVGAAPLDSLRPPSRGRDRFRSGMRMTIALVGGLATTVLAGLALSRQFSRNVSLGLGLGAAVTASLAFMAISPLMVRWLAMLVARVRRPATLRLATTNIERHSGRAGAAANALFIGIMAVAMVLTGTEATRQVTIDSAQVFYPVDVYLNPLQTSSSAAAGTLASVPAGSAAAAAGAGAAAAGAGAASAAAASAAGAGAAAAPTQSPTGGPARITPAQIQRVEDTPGVGALVVVKFAQVDVAVPTASEATGESAGAATAPDQATDQTASAATAPDQVPQSSGQAQAYSLTGLPAGTSATGPSAFATSVLNTDQVGVDLDLAHYLGISLGQRLKLTGPGGSVVLASVPANASGFTLYADADLVTRLVPDAADQMQVRLKDLTSARSTLASLSDFAAKNGLGYSAPVEQRLYYAQAINSSLMVVLSLLAIALFIAIVGISNTLSLSMLERTCESATLRALGLTVRQLQHMLTWEGLIIAVVGAAGGITVGLGLGWLNSKLLLDNTVGELFAPLVISPWLAGVAAVGIGAGLMATLLPARAAARASVVTGLSTD